MHGGRGEGLELRLYVMCNIRVKNTRRGWGKARREKHFISAGTHTKVSLEKEEEDEEEEEEVFLFFSFL